MDLRLGIPSGTSPLVGRDDELRVFGRALDRAGNGTFQFLALSGDPGMGKSRLLGELAATATARGFLVVSGRAAEFEQQIPFAVLVDALDDHLEQHRPDTSEDTIRLLGTVFPALESALGETAAERSAHSDLAGPGRVTGNVGAARYQLHRAVRHLLEDLASASGLVLILDDVHWADNASTELLDYLVRHPPRARVLVAAAYRPAQASPRVAKLVDTAGGHGLDLSVSPLTEAEVDELLGPRISGSRSQALFEASGGNPFYLEALARTERVGKPGVSEETGEPWGTVPEMEDIADLPSAVRAALQTELTALPPTALLMAQAAAAAADEFEPTIVAAGAEISQAEALKALDELVARDIVRPVATGRFRFRHPLVRHVTYGSAAAGWRLGAHTRIAAHLAALGAPPTSRAHHVERSAGYGDQEAIATLITAARTVAAQAPATAAHWLQAAVRLMPDPSEGSADGNAAQADGPSRLELLLELARLQAVSGQLTQGRETALEALRVLPSDDYARRAEAIRFCAVIERLLGRPTEARALVLAELRQLPDPQAPSAIPLRLRLVAESLMRVDFRAAQAVLDLIPEKAPGRPQGLELAIAALRPMPAFAAGRIDDALRYLDTADQLIEDARDDDVGDWMDAIAWLCWTKLLIGRHREALRSFERALAVGQSTGQSYMMAYLLTGQSRAYTMLGQLAEAAAAAEEATEVARLLGSNEPLVMALSQKCMVASLSGDENALQLAERASHLGELAVRSGEQSGEWWGSMARYAHGFTLVSEGQLVEGVARLVQACNDFTSPTLDPGTLLSCCEVLAQAEAARGRLSEALVWADRAGKFATPILEASIGIAKLARAHALAQTQAAEAAACGLAAVDIFLTAGMKLEEGRARLCTARAFANSGDRDRALDELRQAAIIFEGCGARNLHRVVVREQRRLGVRIPSSSSRNAGRLGLTSRELEVANLVAEGCSNQQIAEKLVLSVRTIETHISRIFTKLDITSRVGIANALSRADED